MSRYLVVVTDDRYGGKYLEEESVLKEIDARLQVCDFKNEDEARPNLKDADAILLNLFPMGAGIIETLQRCKVISRYGVGYDNVDVEAATRRKIWIARVPDYSLEDVSDQALALLLGCVRKVAYKDRKIRAGGWNLHYDQPCFRLAGKTLGLIGYGAIARCLHRKVSGLGLARVLVYDPYVKAEEIRKAGAVAADLEALLRESDYVSVHAPLSPETRGLIGESQIKLMKSGAILVNTSRGPLVDEEAVARALQEKRIAGAGLDVFAKEPLPDSSPLRKLDNVILSDHAGWYSEESVVELKTKAARNIVSVFKSGKPIYPVNSVGD